MLGRLPANQRATRLLAAFSDPGHQPLHPVRVKSANSQIVEEHEWFGTNTNQVVDAHGDQVHSDGVQPVGQASQLGFGTHTIGGGHQKGVAVAGTGQVEKTGEPTEVTEHLATVCCTDQRGNPSQRLVGRTQVDTGFPVAVGGHRVDTAGPVRPGETAGTRPRSEVRGRSSRKPGFRAVPGP